MSGLRRYDRGVSEGTGVAALILITLLATGAVGISVLLMEEDVDLEDSSFDFDHSGDTLLITYERGETLTAGNLTITSDLSEVTWAELANREPEDAVRPGDAIQLSDVNAWGHPVDSDDEIAIVYTTADGNETTIADWGGRF